ncbi:MAG: tRNA 2-thiouridine(34) synthase MnmA [Candidatus Altarchaeaceae archaeon]
MNKNKKVIVLMSGGVDSSVSAALLKEQGYDVEGIFMKIYNEEEIKNVKYKRPACYGPKEEDIKDVQTVCEKLNIPLHIIDLIKEYRKIVLDYFVDGYLKGITPNPCIICNRYIKFGILIERAKSLTNFDFIATGHYANVEYDKNLNRYLLKRAVDKKKDQSYGLFLLNQDILSKLILPCGKYKKNEIREIARKFNLPVSEKKESQNFISGSAEFLFKDKNIKEGDVVDKNGNVIGKHKGIVYYTLGQRRNLKIDKPGRYYVIKKDVKNNILVVGEEKDLYNKKFIVKDINLISIDEIKDKLRCKVKVRYEQQPSSATIYPIDKNKLEIEFDKPVIAITPGQAAVFYDEDIVIGGGFIDEVIE